METSDWSSLPQDLLVSIAKLTIIQSSVEDFMAFRSTCTSWYLAGRDDECLKRAKPRVPFLMVPEKAEFYSLSRKKRCKMMIPFPEAGQDKKFTGIGFGWVLALETSGEAYMLCPFSGTRIHVPSYLTILPKHESPKDQSQYIRRTVLSANPCQTSKYVLVSVVMCFMAFWRPGDRNWTRVKPSRSGQMFTDLIFSSKDRMVYAVDDGNAVIWSWDMESESPVVRTVSPRPLANEDIWAYLVESSAAELLLVRKRTDTCGFQVHRLEGATWTELTHFEDAIFIGNNASFSIRPCNDDDPVIKSNCVYFTPYPEIPTTGIYSLEDGTVEHLRADFRNPRPLWVAPSSLSFMDKAPQETNPLQLRT